MNWGLIPEVFYDVIARLVPGTLFLLGAFAVYFGPVPFALALVSVLPAANLAALAVVGLLAYFVAVVLKVFWDAGAAASRHGADTKDESPDPFLGLWKLMPQEVSRLVKLQAEINICEVLIPGSVLLLIGDILLAAARPSELLEQRIAVGVVVLICGAACWLWRRNLNRLYSEGCNALQRLSRGRV